jgi:hypothetical protein
MTLRLYLHNPDTIFAALVDQASFTYPLSEVTFDGVTTGAFGDISPGQLVLFGTSAGADDLGRQRVRADAESDTLYFGRSSQGTRDGEVSLADNAHITVLDLRMVWGKIPFIDDDGVIFKDDDIAYTDQTIEPPPVANAGPAVAATIDGDDIITVDFDAGDSFATADGATISTYAWDVGDGTITVGTSASEEITATFPAGFRYVSLTVTDDNSKTHTAYVPVFARDPEDDACISAFESISRRITLQGQQLNVRVRESIPANTYPDGTLVILFDGEPSSAADRSNVLFAGWHQNDDADIGAERTATLKDTVLDCVDVAGKLDMLPWFPNVLQNAETPTKWTQMAGVNVDKYVHYVLQWHSTALDLADWTWSGTGDDYAQPWLGDYGESLFDQANQMCQAMDPDYHLTCNRRGQLRMLVDPMLQDTGDRTATVQTTITESLWSDARYTHQRPPRTHWLRRGAIQRDTRIPPDDPDPDNPFDLFPMFSIAPGLTPGQGLGKQEDNIGIAPNQTVLNSVAGHQYARMNAPQGHINITLAQGNDLDIEPADMTWVQFTITAGTAAQRGLTFTTARGLVHELSIRYNHARTATTLTVSLVWERETSGTAAVVDVKPQAEEGSVPDPDPWPGYFEDQFPETENPLFYGSMKAYILWDGAHVFRTWNIQEQPPTWELVDTGITGTIHDGRYVHVDSNTIGMWLMTEDAIWWCADIMADTPSWDDVLTIATVRAAEETPTTGESEFRAMVPYGSDPGFLIVATAPGIDIGENEDYAQANTWHTHDNGQNWARVTLGPPYKEGTEDSRAFCYCGRYSLEMRREAPGTIMHVRQAPKIGNDSVAVVFTSDDFGDTWEIRFRTLVDDVFVYELDSVNDAHSTASIINPFAGSPSYLVHTGNSPAPPKIWRNIAVIGGDWALVSESDELDLPSGYTHVSARWRVNTRPDNPDFVMAMFRNDSDGHYDLLDSLDRGETWNFVWDSGLGNYQGRSHIVTPNGWPPNPSEWCAIRIGNITLPGQTPIVHTTDYFATTQDKQGNLGSLISNSWTRGDESDDADPGGFGLPRVGANS